MEGMEKEVEMSPLSSEQMYVKVRSKVLPKVWTQGAFPSNMHNWFTDHGNNRELLVNWIKEVYPKRWLICTSFCTAKFTQASSRFAEKVRCAGLRMKGLHGSCRPLEQRVMGHPSWKKTLWKIWEWLTFKPIPTQQEIRGLNKSYIYI